MLQILQYSALHYHSLSSGRRCGCLKIERDIKFRLPLQKQNQAKIFIYNTTMTSYGHYLLLCCRVFRDINETSTEEACLQLDILSFRTLHCQAANVYGKTMLFDRGQTNDYVFFLAFSELGYGFQEFNSRRVSHVFDKVIEFRRTQSQLYKRCLGFAALMFCGHVLKIDSK